MINCYGRLSPGELLRRFGMSEAGPSPHNCCEVGAQLHTDALRISMRCLSVCSSHARFCTRCLLAKKASRLRCGFAWGFKKLVLDYCRQAVACPRRCLLWGCLRLLQTGARGLPPA